MLKVATLALALCACATQEKPQAEPAQIIVSCGTLRGIGMLVVIDGDEKAGMPIMCGEDV